jgi:hypothetical protein
MFLTHLKSTFISTITDICEKNISNKFSAASRMETSSCEY